ncbi:hypothetical protein SISSUDRAFT_1097532 [Sistotremastrum suecicum HHB10207 ss-3]|uniref:DUF6535 domain-containing protein n=1 Tax=Sistotremastrum suecicum HHB10207 ss-3 TaxID=1314776 RepID=A0A165X976_9AGAM|nr:hypothetical protein SISSUDRAFT_1097532 [Sistotremastrum suecicum HHB10207 ss-3]
MGEQFTRLASASASAPETTPSTSEDDTRTAGHSAEVISSSPSPDAAGKTPLTRTSTENTQSTVENSFPNPPSVPEPTSSTPRVIARRELDDDLGWSAVLPTALKRIREMAQSWKDSLDTTLLFIALFSAIVTAFLLPTLSALTPLPGQNTDELLQNLIELVAQIALLNGLKTPNLSAPAPFVPETSDEISAALWYSSLIVSILCAGVTTFARFQMLDIQEIPKGRYFLDKVMRLKERQRLAGIILDPTFDVLHSSIAVAITLFIAGLLYQLWNLHSVTDTHIITAIGIIGTVLAGLVMIYIAFVSVHAVFYEESPFDTSFSEVVRKVAIPSIQYFRSRRHDNHGDPLVTESHHDFDKVAASQQLFSLMAESDSSEHLYRAMPVMIECFDYVGQNVADLEAAVIRTLGPDTNDDTKLYVLKNLTRIKRESIPDFREKMAVIPRTLLRILEEETNKNDTLLEAVTAALLFLMERPLQTEDEKDPLLGTIPYRAELVRRGLQTVYTDDLEGLSASKFQPPPSFLSALILFGRIEWYNKPMILASLMEESSTQSHFLSPYFLAIQWAFSNSSDFAYRTRYHDVLRFQILPALDVAISKLGIWKTPDAISFQHLKSLIESLGTDTIDTSQTQVPDPLSPAAQLRKALFSPCLWILRRLRMHKNLPTNGEWTDLDLRRLTFCFSIVGVVQSPHGMPLPDLQSADWEGFQVLGQLANLRLRETLLFFISKYGKSRLWDPSIKQFIADCNAIVDADGLSLEGSSSLSKQAWDDPSGLEDDDMGYALLQGSRDHILLKELTEKNHGEVSDLLQRMGDEISYIQEYERTRMTVVANSLSADVALSSRHPRSRSEKTTFNEILDITSSGFHKLVEGFKHDPKSKAYDVV